MKQQKKGRAKSPSKPQSKPKRKSGIIVESTEGDGGPTGSGGVASQSPSPGDAPKNRRKGTR
jgi:hypothetical protein